MADFIPNALPRFTDWVGLQTRKRADYATALGLTPTEVGQMLETLRHMQATRSLTLLVIEHVMRALMDLCERIVVLHHGERIAEGTPAQIGADERVLAVYFGAHA